MTRVVLVTGASSGIGLATAVAVAAATAGFTTVGTVRSGAARLLAAAAAARVSIDVRQLELTSQESIESCVDGVVQTHGRLDTLVNNAGIANSSPTLELSMMDLLRTQLEVNFFGMMATSRAAMPHLRATRGRLLTVSSVRGVLGQPFDEAYSAAKFAVEGFMEALARSPRRSASRCHWSNRRRCWTRRWSPAPLWTQRRCEAPALRIPTSAYAREYLSRKLKDPSGRDLLATTRSWVMPSEPALRG